MRMLKFLTITLSLIFILSVFYPVSALEIKNLGEELNVKSAVLMDAKTGTVLYSKNMNESLPPASVTKIMTLLLVFEEIESNKIKYDDVIEISEYASSMGGSQVFLKSGEKMTVDELIKCVTVASANDAAVALAERIAGSEKAFVALMNKKASELGLKNTNFENATGLDNDVMNHLTSAYDIAIISKELLKHSDVIKYTTIWMDTIRNGEFGLANTNKLVRYYKGITGLKTGSTDKAGFCISASAKRENLHLIAVVMGAETSKERNKIVSELLDFGFSNYYMYEENSEELGSVKVLRGNRTDIKIGTEGSYILENKGNDINREIVLNECIDAPIKRGEKVGSILYSVNGKKVAEQSIIALEEAKELSILEYIEIVFKSMLK